MARKSLIPDPDLRRLTSRIVDLQARIALMEQSQRATQLSNSSLENGSITVNDANGNPKGFFGLRPDGTAGVGLIDDPPPSRPDTPQGTPIMAGVSFAWNGQLHDGPPTSTFSHINVYVSGAGPDFIEGPTNLAGTLFRAGSVPVVPLPNGQYWARFVAYNSSNEASEPSLTSAPVSPDQVVADDVLDGIVTELALADDAVTEAKLAANAVTETKIAPDSISTPKIIAGSIQALQLAAGAVLAEKIAAGAVTAEKIQALAITADKIAANAITAGHIQAGAIDAEKIQAGIILTATLQSGEFGRRVIISGEGNEIRFMPEVTETRYARLFSFLPADDPEDVSVELDATDSNITNSMGALQVNPDGNYLFVCNPTIGRGAAYAEISLNQNTISLRHLDGTLDRVAQGGHLTLAWGDNGASFGINTENTNNSVNVLADHIELSIDGGVHAAVYGDHDDTDRGGIFAGAFHSLDDSRDYCAIMKASGGEKYYHFRTVEVEDEDDQVWVTDSETGSSIKQFVIAHPDDPDRYLVHGCTESPMAGVEYWGEATVYAGTAEVELPSYFESLTLTEHRQVQLTPVDDLCLVTTSPIVDGRFTIRCTGEDGTRVAWLVKAERKGAAGFEVEPLKATTTVRGQGPYRFADTKQIPLDKVPPAKATPAGRMAAPQTAAPRDRRVPHPFGEPQVRLPSGKSGPPAEKPNEKPPPRG